MASAFVGEPIHDSLSFIEAVVECVVCQIYKKLDQAAANSVHGSAIEARLLAAHANAPFLSAPF
jgi:hypothetical protein